MLLLCKTPNKHTGDLPCTHGTRPAPPLLLKQQPVIFIASRNRTEHGERPMSKTITNANTRVTHS